MVCHCERKNIDRERHWCAEEKTSRERDTLVCWGEDEQRERHTGVLRRRRAERERERLVSWGEDEHLRKRERDGRTWGSTPYTVSRTRLQLHRLMRQPLVGQGSLVSRLHDHTEAHNTDKWQKFMSPPPGGIRSRNPSREAAEDPSLRPRCRWDLLAHCIRHSVVPVKNLLLTTTLHCSVITTPVYNNPRL